MVMSHPFFPIPCRYHQEEVTRDLLRGMSLDEIHLMLTCNLPPSTQTTPAPANTGRHPVTTPIRPPTLSFGSSMGHEGTPLLDSSGNGVCGSPRSSCRSRYDSFDHFVVLDAESPSSFPHRPSIEEPPCESGGHGGVTVLEVSSDDDGPAPAGDAPVVVFSPLAMTGPTDTQTFVSPHVTTHIANLPTPESSVRLDERQPSLPLRLMSALVDAKMLSVVRKVEAPATAVFLTLTCTLMLFPSCVVRLRSQYLCPLGREGSRLNADLFVPILFVLFNLSDFLGRLLAGFNDFGITLTWLCTAALARFALVPLLLLCRLSDSTLPVLFSSDIFPVVFMILLGLTNGFLSTLAMVMFPSLVSPRKVAPAGNVMILCLNLGLLCGAAFSFIVLFIST